MKKTALICMLLFAAWIGPAVQSSAEQWIIVPGHPDRFYYDRDSIQFPQVNFYELGLFTLEKVDNDVMRVWTKLRLNDSEVARTLYEIKFSKRVFKRLYTIDQTGISDTTYDPAYKPIVPGTPENDLYEIVRQEAVPQTKCLSDLHISD